MKKIINLSVCTILVFAFLGIILLCKQKQDLRKNIIRLHVVANSDSEEDQRLKLQLKDMVVEKLQPIVSGFVDKAQAEVYIRNNISGIEQLSQDALQLLGSDYEVNVSFLEEEFGIRDYDTFSLPSGVYDALRIEIGTGKGKNWWCVVFPSLCIPATSGEFQAISTSSGFSQSLTDTLQQNEGYEIRFFLLDCIGRLENIFH